MVFCSIIRSQCGLLAASIERNYKRTIGYKIRISDVMIVFCTIQAITRKTNTWPNKTGWNSIKSSSPSSSRAYSIWMMVSAWTFVRTHVISNRLCKEYRIQARQSCVTFASRMQIVALFFAPEAIVILRSCVIVCASNKIEM